MRAKPVFSVTRSEAGATLLEALAFMAITAIIIIGSVVLLRSAFTKNDVVDTLTQITAIQTNVRAAHTGKTTYGTVDMTAGLITAGAFPQNMVSGTTVKNNFDGNVTVVGNDRTFYINFTAIAKEGCAQIVQAVDASLFKSLTVNSVAVTLPTTVASAATACNAATNAIRFESI